MMDRLKADEYFCLADEKFDFDITLSPASSGGEEEQEEAGASLLGGEGPPWSPLLTEGFQSICQEALSLASRLEERQEEVGGGESSPQRSPAPPPAEHFVQDPRDKLGLLSLARPRTALSPLKRETFCVRDSPLKLLPPALQPPTGPRLGTASPAGPRTRTQTRVSLRGKTGLGVLPNKPAPPPSTLSGPKRSGPADRPVRRGPPAKGAAGLRRGSRGGSCEDLLSDTASLASDTSDGSLDSSMQGRRARATPPGRAPPAATRKGVETRRHASLSSSLSASFTGKAGSSPVVPGGPRTRRSVVLGKAAEPPAAPATAGARRSLSTTLRRPSVGGRSTPVKRAEPGTPLALTPAKRLMEKTSSIPSLTPSSRPSLAPSSRPSLAPPSSKPSLAPSSKPSLAPSSSRTSLAPSSSRTSLAPSSSRTSLAPSSRPSVAPSSRPSVAPSSRLSLAASKPQQQPGSRVKARAPVAPTQLRRLAGPEGVSTPDAQCIKNPKRLRTTCSLDSFPQGAEPPSTPASGQQGGAQRSTLPTPSGRRLSCIPTRTPRSLALPARPGPPSCSPPGAPEQEEEEEEEEEEVFSSVIQPFSLEEEEAPGLDGPSATTEGPNEEEEDQEREEEEEKENQEREEEAEKENQEREEEAEKENQEREEEAEEENQVDLLSTAPHNKNQELMEFPLVDVPAPLRYPEEKLLIDLSNSPDLVRAPDLVRTPGLVRGLVRTLTSEAGGRELIDLSSPLIKWSPEEKQATTGVLVNISF